jgi:CRISPR-associated protein Csm1
MILNDFSLTPANLIMSSGGKFYILIPNIPGANDKLEHTRKAVDDWFCNNLHGALSLNLAWVSFGEDGFRYFGEVVRLSGDRLNIEKQNRFRTVLTAGKKWQPDKFLMPPFPAGFSLCPSCRLFASIDGGDCRNCASDRTWGRKLRETKLIAIYDNPSLGQRELAGYSVSLLQNEGEIKDKPVQVIGVNSPDTRSLTRFPASFRYFVNYVPVEKGEALDFGEIAENSTGRKYLAFLKADVDNLGKTFAFGLKDRDSVSRLTTLSRQLDLFFTGWVEHLLEKDFKDCYSVFSGGDDLFIVGPWNRILDFASILRRNFGEYTGNNPKLTLSAGVVIAPSSYPISTAAVDAEDAVELSKQGEKNRITLLGHTLTWNDWWQIEKQWQLLKTEPVTSALLYSLLEYGKMWQAWDRGKGDVMGLRFQPIRSLP